MSAQHPITQPPELVKQWDDEWFDGRKATPDGELAYIATQAAQWGADRELEACCEWFICDWTNIEIADKLRAARRPKPPSLKEQALKALLHLDHGQHNERCLLIRRAIEQLPDAL